MAVRNLRIKLGLFLTLIVVKIPTAIALESIIRPYQSVRSVGMGGVIMTTGLYDENFFNNPARATANPESKLTLLQITPLEITPATLSQGSQLLAGNDAMTTIANNAGQNIHDRFQLVFPAYYRSAAGDRKLAVAFGLIATAQMDASLTQSWQGNVGGISDVGPAITVARQFLPNEALSVGLTGHFIYRLGASPVYSLLDYVKGTQLAIGTYGGEGAMVDFDLGSTYKLTHWGEFQIEVALAMQNVLGGTYSNIPLKPLRLSSLPPAQNRSVGFGGSAVRPHWGKFHDTTFALEMKDMFNNGSGSLFRLIHLGAETHWRSLAFRLGVNQGYWTAGLGLDLRFFTLDLASYGEELGLNSGDREDRRYTANIAFHVH